MWCGLAVCFAHEYEQLTAWIAGAGRPPLAGVEDVVVTIAADRALYVGGIGRGYGGLGHGETGADGSVQQGFQPALLVLIAGEARQHLHVAGVRCRAIEYFGPDGRAAHDLAKRRIVEIAQAGAEFGFR